MPTYARSRLEASGTVTDLAKHNVEVALDKQVRTAPDEKLMMEVEMYIPDDVSDIKGNKQRVAEVVVKLVKKLKEGPLKDGKDDQEWLDGAIKFLVTDEGKAWTQWWFQPKIAAIGGGSTSPTIAGGKASTVAAEKFEHQGGPRHGAGIQLIYGMLYGGPFPIVSSSSEEVLARKGMQVERNAKNERWAVFIMRRVMAPPNMMTWVLFSMLLVQHSQGYLRN